MRHKLSGFWAACTRVPILLFSILTLSKYEILFSRPIIELTDLLTMLMMFSMLTSGLGLSGMISPLLSSCGFSSLPRFLCTAIISSRKMARRIVGSCVKQKWKLYCIEYWGHGNVCVDHYLEIGLDQAACCGNCWCREWPRNANGRQIFNDIRGETEWNRTVSVQLTRCVVHIEFEVWHVDQTGVLVNVDHVGVETCQLQRILTQAGQRYLQSELGEQKIHYIKHGINGQWRNVRSKLTIFLNCQ